MVEELPDDTARDLGGKVTPEQVENVVREWQPDEPVLVADGGQVSSHPRGVVGGHDVVEGALYEQRRWQPWPDIGDRGHLPFRLLGHPVEPLIARLTRAVLREDADFHTYQMLETGLQQYRQSGESAAARHILIAVARYICGTFSHGTGSAAGSHGGTPTEPR